MKEQPKNSLYTTASIKQPLYIPILSRHSHTHTHAHNASEHKIAKVREL